SGGQRRRALIARTLVLDASIIALDEPLAGVDPASAQVISRVLEALRDSGKLVLVTSHDIDQARTADRVLLLNKHQVAYGPPATALSEAALLATYEAELTVIGEHDGQRTVTTVSHHDHEH
ncbi:MAG: hypothetical protein JHC87_06820, partial [Thermoleophilaceae bacterium]|nr:hypothetical protein [Thermoleophilaceae bacterium]